MFEQVLQKFSKNVSFENGKLVNKAKLDIPTTNKRCMVNTTIEGTVMDIKRGFSNYYLMVTLKVKQENGYKKENFRIYDMTGDLFKRTVGINDKVICVCEYNMTDTRGKHYNKIRTFNKLETEPKMETLIYTGTLTNTNNVRDKHTDDEVAFCFKPNMGKKVYYIIGDRMIMNSKWFNKNEKISIEVIQDKRDIKFPNETYRLITMWKS